jgi:hypothetical protein
MKIKSEKAKTGGNQEITCFLKCKGDSAEKRKVKMKNPICHSCPEAVSG